MAKMKKECEKNSLKQWRVGAYAGVIIGTKK